MPLVIIAGMGIAVIGGLLMGLKSDDIIRDEAELIALSPVVHVSPEAIGGKELGDAFSKANKLLAGMTLLEKAVFTAGESMNNGCQGAIPPIQSINFPGLCLSDGANGLRGTDFVSSFPSGIHVGASWNRRLTRERGLAMAAESKKKGVNVLLGPVVGPLGRIALGGRNWEGFSSDPYLAGSLAYKSIEGIQSQGVIASTKHFIGNEQETNRSPEGDVASVSSNIDDKTMHELYLWPFQDALKAGTGSIMCSYQRVNNTYGCGNSKTLNGLLKTELGFQGFVVSDWSAEQDGLTAPLSGLDMAMPDSKNFWAEDLIEAVENGTVPEYRIHDMALRVTTMWYHLHQDTGIKEPGKGMPQDIDMPHKIVDARDPAARQILLDGAMEGHVLVKNTKDTLPLKTPKLLSIFGYSAKSPDIYAPVGSTGGALFTWKYGAEPVSGEEVWARFSGENFSESTVGVNGTMISGGGSSGTTPGILVSPLEALKMRAYYNDVAVLHDLTSQNPLVNPASDACFVFGNAWASESYDRPALRDDYTDDLIKSVADQCSKTIVVLHNAGIRLVDEFVDHPNVTAIIFAHLPGQYSGPALVSLLFGESNFSGKLPYTVAKNKSDYGPLLGPTKPSGNYSKFPQSDFDEGVYIDYRDFDAHGKSPRYEFGFGLGYTTFNFTNLTIEEVPNANTDEWPTGNISMGGQVDLWDPIINVTATVGNTGDVAGAEVAQLYLGIPNAPKKQLRGFEKLTLAPDNSTTAIFELTRRDLSVWSTEAQRWQLQRGEYTVYVGNSSRDLPLSTTFKI